MLTLVPQVQSLSPDQRAALLGCLRTVAEAAEADNTAGWTWLEELEQALDARAAAAPVDLSLLAPVADLTVTCAALVAVADGILELPEREAVEQLELELDATAGLAERALEWGMRGVRWMDDLNGLVRGTEG